MLSLEVSVATRKFAHILLQEQPEPRVALAAPVKTSLRQSATAPLHKLCFQHAMFHLPSSIGSQRFRIGYREDIDPHEINVPLMQAHGSTGPIEFIHGTPS
jgi:hypothetical protein